MQGWLCVWAGLLSLDGHFLWGRKPGFPVGVGVFGGRGLSLHCSCLRLLPPRWGCRKTLVEGPRLPGQSLGRKRGLQVTCRALCVLGCFPVSVVTSPGGLQRPGQSRKSSRVLQLPGPGTSVDMWP